LTARNTTKPRHDLLGLANPITKPVSGFPYVFSWFYLIAHHFAQADTLQTALLVGSGPDKIITGIEPADRIKSSPLIRSALYLGPDKNQAIAAHHQRAD